MISILNKHNGKSTIINRKDSLTWEFILYEPDYPSDDFDLKQNSYLDRKGLRSLIFAIKKLINKKPSFREKFDVQWRKNPSKISFEAKYSPDEKIYDILVEVDYQTLKFPKKSPQEDYYYALQGIDTTKGRTGYSIETTEANLKKYISELEKELGETGEVEARYKS